MLLDCLSLSKLLFSNAFHFLLSFVNLPLFRPFFYSNIFYFFHSAPCTYIDPRTLKGRGCIGAIVVPACGSAKTGDRFRLVALVIHLFRPPCCWMGTVSRETQSIRDVPSQTWRETREGQTRVIKIEPLLGCHVC